MRYLSVCSGIEAATCAWHPLGWTAEAYSEIEPFPSAVLAHHYPDTPNLGDMTKFKEWPDAAIDVLVGGTPCQSFSVAGLRKGLDDPRGNLMLTYLAITDKYRPRWLVWENVPGVLSSNGGRDFASFLRGLAELGYGFAYRVLDAQYFGVPQRRRRVFVVGHLGDWRRAAAVLFERHSLSGHPAPRREAGKVAARPIAAGSKRGSGYRNDADTADNLIAGTLNANGKAAGSATQQDAESGMLLAFGGNNTSGPIDVATARNACASASGRMDFESETFIPHSLRGEGFDASEDGTGRGTPLVPVPHLAVMPTMMNGANTPAGHNARSGHSKDSYIVPMGFAQNQRDEVRMMEVAGALAGEPGMKQQTYLQQAMQVRRLTPIECERLQGFEDNYTLIPYRGKPAADGPRYKALGNSMAVPVMRWIGERIALVDAIATPKEQAA